MRVFPGLSALCALILLQCASASAFTQSHFSRHLRYNAEAHLILGYRVGENGSVFYAICDEHSSESAKCRLFLETRNDNGTTVQRVCPLDLSSSYKIQDYFALFQLGRNELMFVWYEGRKHFAVSTMKMDDCERVDRKMRMLEPIGASANKNVEVNLVRRGDDTFDLLYRSDTCFDNWRCAITYNSRTRKFKNQRQVVPVRKEAWADIWPVQTSEPTERLGYMIHAKYRDGSSSLNLVNASGNSLLELSLIALGSCERADVTGLATSVAESTFGFCLHQSGLRKLRCSMIDARPNGTRTLGVDVSLRSERLAVLRMRNLPDGGFLLLVGYTRNGLPGLDKVDMLRLDARGKITESFELTEVLCAIEDSDVNVDFFEMPGQEYCYYVACTSPRSAQFTDEFRVDRSKEFHLGLFSECLDPSTGSQERPYVRA